MYVFIGGIIAIKENEYNRKNLEEAEEISS